MRSMIRYSVLFAMSLLLAAMFGFSAAPTANAEEQAKAACAHCQALKNGNPNLFYNFYAPEECGGLPATMYVAPQPVPASVGHTYITYQPMMPHEMLYPHHRSYYRYYDGGRGMTRAHVRYYRSPFSAQIQSVKSRLKIAR